MKYTKSLNKSLKKVLGALLCCSMALAPAVSHISVSAQSQIAGNGNLSSSIKKLENKGLDLKNYLNDSVVTELSSNIKDDQDVSVIISTPSDSLLKRYNERSKAEADRTVSEYVLSPEGSRSAAGIRSEIISLKDRFKKAGFDYEFGEEYNIVLTGFEVKIKAKDYGKLSKLVGDDATLIMGEVYERCDTDIVENIVNVDENTGIFNSQGSSYDGSGTVIAVLDTGLDYTHSAFDVERFDGDEVLGIGSGYERDISSLIGKSQAASLTEGLTASDVYVNKKIPFAYDYADCDPDVYPINSDHGTHVSGIIVGNDDTIRGVAPNAQLVSMKVFSDSDEGARQSWILSALQDAVLLGVDVINLSLGSSAGFTTPKDDEEMLEVYNSIADAGISLVTAASNDASAFTSSVKNGSLGLTSNPDTSTVGSPSTYESALSVASVSGTKTPYLKFGDNVIYFNEASNQASEPKNFVNEILTNGATSATMQYVTIPGVGRAQDYNGIDVTGKIALVERGSTTFEEKVRVASQQKAAGIIIYNNVSGKIAMTVGRVNLPACSISQDDGRLLAAQGTGTIQISTSQLAGPFMSSFSSWGPTPDLKIKPEITAHGGDILSSVPGQGYDRLSGTSMASPNQAGVTALIRQYVKETFPTLAPKEVTARVNQIMMSTADVIYGSNGLASSVRLQGAGLANLTKATTTPAYISTFDTAGNEMEKAKLELGDDVSKTGVFNMTFAINNISGKSLTYDVGAIVMTEGVSETLTVRGDTVVTEEGYALAGTIKVNSVSGGTASGNSVTVAANSSVKVQAQITLTDEDKAYIEKSFANGMYVEGFVTFTESGASAASLNVPYLAFYGNWNQAPIFDLDYFETNPDELNDAIDDDKKTMADMFATTPVGSLYDDYISYLGSYAFTQDPSAVKIAADREHISLTYLTGEEGGVNGINSVYAGLLRGADHIDITITDSITGEVIFYKQELNKRKTFSNGGSAAATMVDIDFNMGDYELKNNTRYDVKLAAYTPYGDGGFSVNKRNTFEFSFVTDFEAPVVTGCNFRTETDASTKKTRLYADISIYDNHYSQAAAIGYIYRNEGETYTLDSFDRYLIPMYSSFNSDYTLTYELTDHIDQIKNSYNKNSFVVQVIDYAFNTAVYEVAIPDIITEIDSFLDANGNVIDGELVLSPNELYDVNLSFKSQDGNSWQESVTFSSADENIAGVVGGKIIARNPGTTVITATSNASADVSKSLTVRVLSAEDEGYVDYSKPVTDYFRLTEYHVEKSFFLRTGLSHDIGEQDHDIIFSSHSLTFYPSESITVKYDIKPYFPGDYEVVFASSNPDIVTVDEKTGTIVAQAEGNATISVNVLQDGRPTYYSQTIAITVRNPFTTNGFYLMSYAGLGGEVVIPEEFAVTEIYQYAFCGYDYVPKDEDDPITKEDPYHSKVAPLSEDTITKVVIPEGVEVINKYAFANLTALEEVVLPSTLKKIQSYAFSGCTKLKKINLENVQFINERAFYCCPVEEVNFSSIRALGNGAFEFEQNAADVNNTPVKSLLRTVTLPVTAQSIGSRAFANNTALSQVVFRASSVKLGSQAFVNCTSLASAIINAPVVPSSAFEGCERLNSVTLGRDVSVIGSYAFRNTQVTRFAVDSENPYIKASADGTFILNKAGNTLVLAAPQVRAFEPTGAEAESIVTIGEGAFSGNGTVVRVVLPNVTAVNDFAFAGCVSLNNLQLGALKFIGEGAFGYCYGLVRLPSFDPSLREIGAFAFSASGITEVVIDGVPDGETFVIGEGAFAECNNIEYVRIGNNVVIGDSAFYSSISRQQTFDGPYEVEEVQLYVMMYAIVSDGKIAEVEIGNNVEIGDSAFAGQLKLEKVELGNNIKIKDHAFYLDTALKSINLEHVTEIGESAFAGAISPVYAGTRDMFGGFTPAWLLGYDYLSMSLVNIDLSSLKVLGNDAFSVNQQLKTVRLGSDLKVIGDGAFSYDVSLLEVINLQNVSEIGAYAFQDALSLERANLSGATKIGNSAFMMSYDPEDEDAQIPALSSVTFAKGDVEIGDAAFYGAVMLSTANNLNRVTKIGKQAFTSTNLTSVDLFSAVSIDDFAFSFSAVTSVKLSAGLSFVGENPFAYCEIPEFKDDSGNTTFTLSENVFVEDGVLYTHTPNGGIVLVSYPTLKADKNFTVKSGTVRISALAFLGNENLVKVELPYELKAVGDKAFYLCNSLTVVVFKSLAAPVLEERYDESYQIYSNLPMTGYFDHREGDDNYKGLGVVPFYMWNVNGAEYFYGANFINYVGKQDKPLIFVTPSNGQYYEAFIISQYYMDRVDGAVAPYEQTLNVISIIAALPAPESITIADKAAIEAARAAYDAIGSLEQQALVSNYATLTSAENTLAFLIDKDKLTPPDNPEEPDEDNVLMPLVITFATLTGVFFVAAVVVTTLWVVDKKRNSVSNKKSEDKSDEN